MTLLSAMACIWMIFGIIGSKLALQLLMLASEDRGRLAALGVNGVYRILSKKMCRLAFHRILIGLIAVLTGLIVIVTPSYNNIEWHLGTFIIAVGLVLVSIINTTASYCDLADRDKISHEH